MLARVYLFLFTTAVAAVLTATSAQGQGLDSRISIKAIVWQDASGQDLRGPISIFYDRYSGELFVVDPGSRKVVVYDLDLNPLFDFQHRIPGRQGGRIEIGEPKRVVCNKDGEILLVDNLADFVDVLDFRGRPNDRIYPNQLLGDTSLSVQPDLMAIDENDNVYLSVTGDVQTILVLDREYRLKRRIGQSGDRPEDFKTIVGLTVDAGQVYVVDVYGLPAVKVFDTSGVYLFGFGAHGIDRGDLSMGQGLTVHRDSIGIKTVWIADALRQLIKVYDESGTFVANVGGFGGKPGEFRYPSGIAVTASGSFYVVERGGKRIQRLDYR